MVQLASHFQLEADERKRFESRAPLLLDYFVPRLAIVALAYVLLFHWIELYMSMLICVLSFVMHVLTMGALVADRIGPAKMLHFVNWWSSTMLLSLSLSKSSGFPLLCIVVALLGCLLFDVHLGTPFKALLLSGFCSASWMVLHFLDDSLWWMRENVSPAALARANEIVNPVITVSTIFFVCGFIFWSRFINSEQERALRCEQLLVNKVVLGLLPQPIFDRLKHGEEFIADLRPCACVLFMDIVGFTSLSELFPPRQLVQGLMRLFADIEACVKRFPRVQKVKTIGDAFMCASGLTSNEMCELDLVQMAELALVLREEHFALHFVDAEGCLREVPIQFRIGIHCGEVIAGIISRERYTFDVLGDTVNTASRMESNGKPQMIHVSDEFKARLEHLFEFVDNGRNFVKGKGRLQTWFLAGPKQDGVATAGREHDPSSSQAS